MSSTRRPTGNASSSGAKKAKLDASVAVAPPAANVKQGTDSEGKQYKNMDELWKQQFEGQTSGREGERLDSERLESDE